MLSSSTNPVKNHFSITHVPHTYAKLLKSSEMGLSTILKKRHGQAPATHQKMMTWRPLGTEACDWSVHILSQVPRRLLNKKLVARRHLYYYYLSHSFLRIIPFALAGLLQYATHQRREKLHKSGILYISRDPYPSPFWTLTYKCPWSDPQPRIEGPWLVLHPWAPDRWLFPRTFSLESYFGPSNTLTKCGESMSLPPLFSHFQSKSGEVGTRSKSVDRIIRGVYFFVGNIVQTNLIFLLRIFHFHFWNYDKTIERACLIIENIL